MSTTDFERRTRACQERLREQDVDAAVLFPSPNLYYASGFHESPGERHLFLFVPSEGDPVFLVPELYGSQVRDESWIGEVHTWADGEDPVEHVREILAPIVSGGAHVLVDDTMWALFTQDLEAALPDATFGLASEVFDDLRMRKDETELDALRRAGELADSVSTEVRKLGRSAIGMTERELAEEIESSLASAGGEGLSFEVIVGAGPNGAKPHHHHSDRKIRTGEPVVLDFGAWVDHYPGDQTRTVVFAGDPPARFEEVHELVCDALDAGVAAVEPGVEAQAVDRAAREVIEDAGYGDQFIHRTGHGVGLDVHEPPYIVEGNALELEPGMVFSVEPGVYIEGEFGVRVEDLVVVTEDGCERLNDSPRTWESL
ncbi:M24 family metallopeptidase [Haloarchaeobius sp. DFWS5]|uniref:M24 family metallopeptidase n=1 Tax=Haloarchaeobius sp. DFWS5 TaxID=3446114 RepID=UPI003EB93CC3